MNRKSPKVDLTARASLAVGNHSPLANGTILHPTDYSPCSRQVFELACRLARDRGSRLVVMHVAEPVRMSSLGMATPPPLPKGYRGAWESRLRLLHPNDPTVRVEHRLEEGDVADAILRVAREVQANLIVMAGREQTWLSRLLKASITEKVERKARCPVLRPNAQPMETADQEADGGAIVGGELKRDLGGGDHDFSSHNPASDGFLAQRRKGVPGGLLVGP